MPQFSRLSINNRFLDFLRTKICHADEITMIVHIPQQQDNSCELNQDNGNYSYISKLNTIKNFIYIDLYQQITFFVWCA